MAECAMQGRDDGESFGRNKRAIRNIVNQEGDPFIGRIISHQNIYCSATYVFFKQIQVCDCPFMLDIRRLLFALMSIYDSISFFSQVSLKHLFF